MKTIETIAKEFIKKVKDCDLEIYENYKDWKFYNSICGYNKHGEYFDVYIRETKDGVRIVDIAHTTENPQDIINILKKIESNQEITYTETTKREMTV